MGSLFIWMRRVGIPVACLAASTAVPASAQGPAPATPQPRTASVFGAIGFNSQLDDESTLGRGFTGGAGIEVWLTPRLAVGGELLRLAHRRELTFYEPSVQAGTPVGPDAVWRPVTRDLTGTATYLLGELTYSFTTGRLQPHATGMLGVMRYSGTPWNDVLPGGVGNASARASSFTTTAMAFGGAAGLNVTVARGFWIGPSAGLMLTNTGEAGTKYALYGVVRVGYDLAKERPSVR